MALRQVNGFGSKRKDAFKLLEKEGGYKVMGGSSLVFIRCSCMTISLLI